MSTSQGATFKECAGNSKTSKTGICSNKVKETFAKLIKRVTPKNDVHMKVTPKNEVRKKVILKDRGVAVSSRSGKPSEGCVLAQNLTPKEDSTKRPIKINVGGTSANSDRQKMMAKLRSRRRGTLD